MQGFEGGLGAGIGFEGGLGKDMGLRLPEKKQSTQPFSA